MSKLIVIVLCLCIAMIPQQAKSIPDRIVNPQEIVHRVNKNPESTWNADSYGMDEFNVDQFARSRLGVIIGKRNDKVPENIRSRIGARINNRDDNLLIAAPGVNDKK